MKILVDIDGVIKTEDDTPINTGILWIATLSAHNQIYLLTSMSAPQAEQWFNIHGVVDYDGIIDSSVHLVDEDMKKRQVNVARSLNHADMLITNDPHLWAYSFDIGIPSVMFAIPTYTRPEFRPDAPKSVRAWDSIEKSIKEQNTLRTQDARLTRGEGVRFE